MSIKEKMMSQIVDENCSKLLRVCGYAGERLYPFVLSILNQSFSCHMKEAGDELKKTVRFLSNRPLSEYREKSELEASWRLIEAPPPFLVWNFLTGSNPEKAGIPCGYSKDEVFILTKECVDTISGADKLRHLICRWGDGIRFCFASFIMEGFLPLVRQEQLCLPSFAGYVSLREKETFAKPIGELSLLYTASDEEIGKLNRLCELAQFGSADCEYAVSGALRTWLGNANIESLKRFGFNIEQAHGIIQAVGEREPRFDIKMQWSPEIGSYRYVCFVSNLDGCGYPDGSRTAEIPAVLLEEFFNNSSDEIRGHFVRLVLRAGYRKARSLLLDSIMGDLY
jgi:hypothetical protein